jgi:hypothetical protein
MNISKVIDYVALLIKLKHEFITYFPPPFDKKPHNDVQTFYSSDSQLHLLDVCGYKGYNEPLGFASSTKANQFFSSFLPIIKFYFQFFAIKLYGGIEP